MLRPVLRSDSSLKSEHSTLGNGEFGFLQINDDLLREDQEWGDNLACSSHILLFLDICWKHDFKEERVMLSHLVGDNFADADEVLLTEEAALQGSQVALLLLITAALPIVSATSQLCK